MQMYLLQCESSYFFSGKTAYSEFWVTSTISLCYVLLFIYAEVYTYSLCLVVVLRYLIEFQLLQHC